MLSVTPYICKSGTWYYPIRHSSFSFNKARRSQVSYCTMCDYKLRHDDIYNLFIIDHKGTILIQMKRPWKKNANFLTKYSLGVLLIQAAVWYKKLWCPWIQVRRCGLTGKNVGLAFVVDDVRKVADNQVRKNLIGWPVDVTVNSSGCNKRHGRFGFEVGVFI